MKMTSRVVASTAISIVVIIVSLSSACCQIFTANFGTASIGLYSLDGVPINPNFITGLGSGPYALALDGKGSLYVASYFQGTISKYTTNGALISASLIPGLTNPTGMAFDANGDLYIAESASGEIGKYSSTGAVISLPLISGVGVSWGLAIDNQNGFLYEINFSSGTVGKFTTAGQPIDPALISGLKNAKGLAVDSQGNLYVGDATANFPIRGMVWKYSAAGALISKDLVVGLGPVEGLAFDSNDRLYVVDRPDPFLITARVGVFKTDGTAINPSLIPGLEGARNVVVWSPRPPPTLSISKLNYDIVRLSWPTNASGYLLEFSTNHISAFWNPVAEAAVVEGESFVVDLPTLPKESWYRLRK